MAELQLPKLTVRVRFPLLAPLELSIVDTKISAILSFLGINIANINHLYGISTIKISLYSKHYSIFDICWYTLSRFIATNSGSLDLDLSIDTEDFRSTHIGVCRSCGRYMEMKSNRQLYCKRDACQRDRKIRKQKDFQQRKRENAN